MIAATTPLSPSLPSATYPADLNPDAHRINCPAFQPQHRRCQPTTQTARTCFSHIFNVLSHMWTLYHFLQPTLFVFSLTDSFWKKGGMGEHDKFFSTQDETPPKGRKPRTAWGEAHPGLGG